MVRISLECDSCGQRSHAERNGKYTISLMRRRAAAVGWSSNEKAGKDYCPSCTRGRLPARQAPCGYEIAPGLGTGSV